ncbi:TIGR01777 family oxidoreductase [Aegicerativicinus sediminis]
MRVLITGATGLIGTAIIEQLISIGWNVNFLTRSRDSIDIAKFGQGFLWDPDKGTIDMACFKDVDVIINLAGATIAKRWTKSYKQKIINSRTQSLELLFKSLKQLDCDVQQVISASAIGLYPSSLTKYYEESTDEIASNFLGKTVEVWESKADLFNQLNIKVSKVRIGLVLDSEEGALPKMVQPIKLGLGAAFGKGDQWQSWIHIEDLAGIMVHILEEELEGVFNAVAPNPVTNKELTETIAKVLNKPLVLPNIPKAIIKLGLGEMHQLLFDSQRVSSAKIEETGYSFKYPNVQPALENLLNK